MNGAGRHTLNAEMPTRAVSKPLSTPSPMRAEIFDAMPWPTTCWMSELPTAMPPVMARWAPIERSEPEEAQHARTSAVNLGDAPAQPRRPGR